MVKVYAGKEAAQAACQPAQPAANAFPAAFHAEKWNSLDTVRRVIHTESGEWVANIGWRDGRPSYREVGASSHARGAQAAVEAETATPALAALWNAYNDFARAAAARVA